MTNYQKHAQREFRAAGWLNADGTFKDEMQQAICEHVIVLLDVFAGEGHSGSSAPYAINLFKQLASFEPIVPLSGDDAEWNEVGPGVFQNNRCSHVFKDKKCFNGQAYDMESIIFYDWYTDKETGEKHKSYFTCRESCMPVVFPYTPAKQYLEREE